MQPGVPVERIATKGSQGGAGRQGTSFGRGPNKHDGSSLLPLPTHIMSRTMSAIQKDREAAYEECRALHPTRYTSDPDVINNPEAMAAVKAEWDIYFRAMDAVLVRFPYTDEEKLHHPAKTCQLMD